jgi:hypothetical protein
MQSDLLHNITEEGEPDKNSLSSSGPFAPLVPPSSPWNNLSKHMIGVHTPSGAVISSNLISLERYEWLHTAQSRRARPEDFLQDLIKLLARYHPRAQSLNSQGRRLKLTNHRAIPLTSFEH